MEGKKVRLHKIRKANTTEEVCKKCSENEIRNPFCFTKLAEDISRADEYTHRMRSKTHVRFVT